MAGPDTTTDLLGQLRRAAEVRRAARARVADARWTRTDPTVPAAAAQTVTTRWAQLIVEAADAGVAIAAIARAAGCTPASVHYRLAHPGPRSATNFRAPGN